MSNKIKIIIISVFLVFIIYAVYQLTEHTLIPAHVHSVDDKPAEQRTDEDNILMLERILQKEPENVNAMIEISDLYLKTADNSKAKKYLNKVLEIDPSNKEAKNRLERLK